MHEQKRVMRQVANKKAKTSTDSVPDDVIIEGEVSARDDNAPVIDTPLAAKTNMTASIFAILFSLMALSLASFIVYERQNAADSFDDKLALVVGQMAEMQSQTRAQATQIAKLDAALQEALFAKPETKSVTNQRQVAGLMALMMWQDMRAGQALNVYQPFIMTLQDEDAKARLIAVIADWQTLDYQGLLAQGRAFIGRGQARYDDKNVAHETQKEGLLSGVGKWVAGLVKLEPLAVQEQVPAQQAAEQEMVTSALRLDEILAATAIQEGAEIAAWRRSVKQVATQQARLSALVIDYLTDEAILP